MSDRKVLLKDMNQIPPEDCLFNHLYEKILSGELRDFASLSDYVSSIPPGRELNACLFRAFKLQRKLYWGFFAELTPKKYSRLWKEVVLPDSRFPFAGTLKRSMSIPDIYMALIDIHGYTRFCSKQSRNLSMIDLLDRMIYEDVKAICSEDSVMSQRARGDEILLLGASAADVMKTTLRLMEYFNTQGSSFPDTVLRKRLPGTVLPKFKISAGIAGGQKFTPLVITRNGDVSGDMINTAARLQAKANKISPHSNKIMITGHVYQKIQPVLERNETGTDLKDVDFFKVGSVEFKGTKLMVYDIIFLPVESRRLELRRYTEELIESLNKKQWKSRILNRALNLAAKVVKERLDQYSRKDFRNDRRRLELNALLEEIKSAVELFNDSYYETAISIYSRIISELEVMDKVDPIVLQYLQLVQTGYEAIYDSFTESMDEEIEVRKNEIFISRELDTYLALKKSGSMRTKLQSQARIRLKNRRSLWHRTTDNLEDNLRIVLQSLK